MATAPQLSELQDSYTEIAASVLPLFLNLTSLGYITTNVDEWQVPNQWPENRIYFRKYKESMQKLRNISAENYTSFFNNLSDFDRVFMSKWRAFTSQMIQLKKYMDILNPRPPTVAKVTKYKNVIDAINKAEELLKELFNFLFKNTYDYKTQASKFSSDLTGLINEVKQIKERLENSVDRPFMDYKNTLDSLHSKAVESEKKVASIQFKSSITKAKVATLTVTGVISILLFPPAFGPFTVGIINSGYELPVNDHELKAAMKENNDNLDQLKRFRNSKNIVSYVMYDLYCSLQTTLSGPNVSLVNSIDSFSNFLKVFNNAINAVQDNMAEIKKLLSTADFTREKYKKFLVNYKYISQFSVENSLTDFLQKGDKKHQLGGFEVLEPDEVSG